MLHDVAAVNEFVDRPSEMAELERGLLPSSQNCRRKLLFLHGLGGIGKTQLAIEFARRHHSSFSSVFWLDGRNNSTVKQSIVTATKRIPPSAGERFSRKNVALDKVIEEFMNWLSEADNNAWLLIFDNVDRSFVGPQVDSDAYDVNDYFPGADHGSILVTTRLANLGQLGTSLKLTGVGDRQARAIFENRYGKSVEGRLLDVICHFFVVHAERCNSSRFR